MKAATLAISALAVLPVAARSQDLLTLRFDPADGAVLHRVFQAHTRLTVRDGETPRVRETADLGGIRQVALRRRAGESVVHVTFDSLRIRTREGAAAWRELQPAGLDSLWLQARLDPRLRVLGVRSGGPKPARATLLELVTGVPGMALPPEPVGVGDEWPLRAELPLSGVVFEGVTGESSPSLSVRATATIDSIVARQHDTLAYLSVVGPVGDPGPVGPHGDLVDSGGLAARLVWSTGWGGFVSAATRFTLRLRRPAASSADRRERWMVLETTVRQRVSS